MPISAAGSNGHPRAARPVNGFMSVLRPAERGFTLIELMVVVTIIGLASAVAVLAMPDPRGRLMDEAARFATRVRAAHDSAIIDARPVSVWVTPSGYGFDQWRGGRWTAMVEKPLRVERWSQGTGATGLVRERVTFDTTGLADKSLNVSLRRDGTSASVAIAADGSVRVAG
ncbi:GspH/FimT family pseudopilin [uncultured Sphingomonas sp.]|uniref:GspH/FimT family pseudopilin n=1 Tax=uncultured Sphingomonas sp. TaxID=158754 RepID=UPI0025EA5486|nr:GspH/FimT family pseudopilin [uncultured Sphingomonas sp.]